jgi:hypothetical protein
MAWTDACKVEAVAQIDKRKEIHGGVRPAIRELSKESGIPYDTLQKWYHPRKNESVAENGYTPKAKNTKQTSTTCDLHTLTFDSGRKKILFELIETDGNQFLAMQEYRTERKGKEIPTKNRFAIPMDLIAWFRAALDQAVIIIQERCPEESEADVPDHEEDNEAEPAAEADEGGNRESDSDGLGVEIAPSPPSTDATEDATVETPLVRCAECNHFAVKTLAPTENGGCNTRSGSWNGQALQPPNEPHPCQNFQREEHE